MRDEAGEPLFRDLPVKMYLSKSYRLSDLGGLRRLSVKNIHYDDFIERVRADLCRDDSYMKGTTTSADWHSRSAKILLTILRSAGDASKELLRLEIIPLQDGSWTSSESGPIHYPCSNGVPVPADLGLQLVDEAALANESRKELFIELGVADPASTSVIKLIIGKYSKPRNVSLDHSLAHLRYLYYFDSKNPEPLDPVVCLFDQGQNPIYRAQVTFGELPIVDDLYFEADDDYGVKQMCAATPLSLVNSSNCGYPVRFLHPSYLDAVPADARVVDRSWISWLQDVAQVRRIPRLTRSSDSTKLSPMLEYILANSPGRLVGWLHEHWKKYKDTILPNVITAIGEARVNCQGKPSQKQLRRTYLPTSSLLSICDKYNLGRSSVSFLDLSQSLLRADDSYLQFFTIFGVGFEPSLKFYLDVLRRCRGTRSRTNVSLQGVRIFGFLIALTFTFPMLKGRFEGSCAQETRITAQRLRESEHTDPGLIHRCATSTRELKDTARQTIISKSGMSCSRSSIPS